MQKPILIITATFNEDVTQQLEDGALTALQARGVSLDDIHIVKVPGAYEIPFIAQHFLQQYPSIQGIIALGAVIRGETYHFEVIANESARALMDVMLKTGKPIINGILTTEDEDQAFARLGGEHGHKGKDAALALLTILDLIQDK